MRAELGQLVEVRLVNESVPAGVTLHWHGVDVPNAEDGVAGVTQDAVPVGGEYTYRFRARQAGTFWYHSHQVSHEQVVRGLFGALVIAPPGGVGRDGGGRGAPLRRRAHDQRPARRPAAGRAARGAGPGPGDQHRQRADGDLGQRRPVPGARRRRHGHARAGPGRRGPRWSSPRAAGPTWRSSCRRPGRGSRCPGRRPWCWVRRAPRRAPTRRPDRDLDLLGYGTPAALPFDPAAATRRFEYAIGRAARLRRRRARAVVDGQRPAVPGRADVRRRRGRRRRACGSATTAARCTRCTCTATTRSCWPATGCRPPAARGGWTRSTCATARPTRSPSGPTTPASGWTTATPQHAAEGLIAHLMYEGVTTPYRVGGPNSPE